MNDSVLRANFVHLLRGSWNYPGAIHPSLLPAVLCAFSVLLYPVHRQVIDVTKAPQHEQSISTRVGGHDAKS